MIIHFLWNLEYNKWGENKKPSLLFQSGGKREEGKRERVHSMRNPPQSPHREFTPWMATISTPRETGRTNFLRLGSKQKLAGC